MQSCREKSNRELSEGLTRQSFYLSMNRNAMHESDVPPAPPRFRRRARCQLVMAHNNWVGDLSTIQTTPPFEIYLAAHIQNVHKMIADHTALTTLASHRLSPDIVRTTPRESGAVLLLLQPCPSLGKQRRFS